MKGKEVERSKKKKTIHTKKLAELTIFFRLFMDRRSFAPSFGPDLLEKTENFQSICKVTVITVIPFVK